METVKEQSKEEMEDEAARLASKCDGDLTDASSAGESVLETSRPAKVADLQGPDKCLQIHVGTLADRSKARLCCGRATPECQQRARKRMGERTGDSLGGAVRPRLLED